MKGMIIDMALPYGIACVVSFLLILCYCVFFTKKDISMLLTFISVFICNTGYLAIALSNTVEEALLANRIAYLGSVFLPFFLFLTIAEVCKFKYHKLTLYILVFITLAMLMISASGGYSEIYYKTAWIESIKGATVLQKEYGLLHPLYSAYLITYFLAMVLVIFRSFFKRKIVSYKNAVFLAIAVFINISLYFAESLFEHYFEFLSVSYIVCEICLLVLYMWILDYDIDNIIQSTLKTDNTGVILFDLNGNFKGCNDDALAVFPALAELSLEYPVPAKELLLQKYIIPALTGNQSAGSTTYKKDEKIYRIVAKPYHRNGNIILKQLGTAIIINDDTAQQMHMQLISSYNNKLKQEVERQTDHLQNMHDNLILSMANMVEGRDPNTGGHIKRTSSVVDIFIRKLKKSDYYNFSDSFLSSVIKAAPMHDLGKIVIEDAILRKPGKYTPDEYAIMQTHSEKGAEIVGRILGREDDRDFCYIAVNVAHYHHEKYDGTGYPVHLKGESIPVEARIMALADVFDALVSKRCYKEKNSYEEAFGIIGDSLGKHFDPQLGRIFLSCDKELMAYYNSVSDI